MIVLFKCSHANCNERAKVRVYLRRCDHPLYACSQHAVMIVKKDNNPEYVVDCPHCGSMFGWN